MAKIIKCISLDVAKPNGVQAVLAKQYDTESRFLLVRLTCDGAPIEISDFSIATVNAKRSDGAAAAFIAEIQADGRILVPLTSWMLALDSYVHCDISVIDTEGRKLTSTGFDIDVERATYSGDEISEDENYDLLVSLLKECGEKADAASSAADAANAAAIRADLSAGDMDAETTDAYITAFFTRARQLGLIAGGGISIGAATISDISESWIFSKEGNASTVSLPHTCNTADGMSSSYYRGETVYSKSFPTEESRSYYLVVEGAGQRSVVYVDGVQIKEYNGGYTHFTVALPALSSGYHTLEIRCNNSLSFDSIPVSADFNFNNGLHRKVWLVSMPTAGFDPIAYGQDRFHIVQNSVSFDEAVFSIKTKLLSRSPQQGMQLEVILEDGNGEEVLTDLTSHVVEDDGCEISAEYSLVNPHLWNGKIDPYLYTVKLRLYIGGTLVDSVSRRVGFRFYSLDGENGFMLNGAPYPLRGVCVHQDYPEHMSAMTENDFDADYAMIDEIGATVVRLAHYPHSRYAYDKCDSLGLIVQTEIPWVNQCGENASEAYFQSIKTNLTSMITNYFNHPSVIFWGMSNELSGNHLSGVTDAQGEYDYEKAKAWTAELYAYAKALDPTRSIGFVSMDQTFLKSDRVYADIYGNSAEWTADWVATNQYCGWYNSTFDKFGRVLNLYHAARPIFAVAEYGAGANTASHSDDPMTTTPGEGVSVSSEFSRHDEEYQNLYHEAHLEQICERPWLIFTTVWTMFDFAVAGRNEGGIPYTNDKGLVTRDRQTKKDCFYLYKAAWSNEPVVYITSRRFENRTSGTVTVKAYANTDTLTLKVDGTTVQALSRPTKCGVIWEFDELTLSAGQHTVFISGVKNGQTINDSVVWTVTPDTTPLSITVQPQDTIVNVSEKATFSVEASGGVAPYTYRWQYASASSNNYNAADSETGGVSAVYTTNERTSAHNGYKYRCVVTDSAGTSVTSNHAVLTVLNTATDFALSTGDGFTLDTSINSTVSATVSYTPANAVDGTAIEWVVSPSGIVTLAQSGSTITLTAVDAGTATLTGTLANGVTHSYSVQVDSVTDSLTVEYSFQGGDGTVLTPITGPSSYTATTSSANVTYSSEGMIPSTVHGDGAVIVPLSLLSLGDYDNVRVTIEFGAFDTSIYNREVQSGEFMFSFSTDSTNTYGWYVHPGTSSTNTLQYSTRIYYDGGQICYNPCGANWYLSYTRQKFVIDIDTATGDVTINAYEGTADNHKGTKTLSCSSILDATKLVLCNKQSYDASTPIYVRGCKIEAWS